MTGLSPILCGMFLLRPRLIKEFTGDKVQSFNPPLLGLSKHLQGCGLDDLIGPFQKLLENGWTLLVDHL